jgi:hypothetical protein
LQGRICHLPTFPTEKTDDPRTQFSQLRVFTKATAAAVGVGVGTVVRIKRELGLEVQPRPGKAELAAAEKL